MSITGTATYLRRLGLDPDLPPTLETLVAMHRAHVEQVPYENLDIMLGRPPSVLPRDSLARLAATGRAGYCFHHNGAFEVVLGDLGYVVERRHGHVWTTLETRAGTELNHLVLLVNGLPTDANPDGRWWPDLGLGEGFVDPLPLLVGTYVDGPLTFSISEVRDDGWTFVNDPSGTFTALEVRSLPIDEQAIAAGHVSLSSAPTGVFTHKLIVQRRTPTTAETIRACVSITVDATGRHEHDLTSYDEWRDALAAMRLPLDDVDAAEVRGLWERSWAAHRAWDDAGRP